MNERKYERELKDRIRERLPGCFIMKNDAQQYQGIPDILILFNRNWAMLEVKMAGDSQHQPNQDHYVEKFGDMSFASFINPETEEAVLDALQQAFGLTGSARLP